MCASIIGIRSMGITHILQDVYAHMIVACSICQWLCKKGATSVEEDC